MAHNEYRLGFRSPLVLLALATALPGQGFAPPSTLRAAAPTLAFDPANLPLDTVEQIHLVRLEHDSGSMRTVALTCRGLALSMGGVGGRDLVSGQVDIALEQLSLDGLAAPLNTPADEFGLMVHHTGLLAVFERQGVGVFVAARSAITAPWAERGRVTGLPPQLFFDPAVANIDGDVHLLFLSGDSIAAARLDLTTLALGPARRVVGPARAGSLANSPTPIVDDCGELQGVSHHDLLAGDNDHYLALDLDPATPSLLALDTPAWINNGAFAGGRFFSASNAATGYRVIDVMLAFMPPVQAGPGEDVFVAIECGQPSVPEPMNPPILIGPGFLPGPITLPGIGGGLGLDPLGMVVLFGGWDPVEERFGAWLRLPAEEALRGQLLPLQGLVLRPGQIAFTNTSQMRIESTKKSVTVAVNGTEFVGVGRRGTVVTSIRPAQSIYCNADPVQQPLPGVRLSGLQATPAGQPHVIRVRYTDNGKEKEIVLCVTVR